MDCQSGCPLKSPNFALFPRNQPGFGVPCLGQCLNMGIDGRTPRDEILVSTKNAAIAVWPNECNLAKVHAHAKDLDDFNSGIFPGPEVKR